MSDAISNPTPEPNPELVPELIPDFTPDELVPIANPLFAIRDDAGPFLQLGQFFSCNKTRWIGPTFASATAIYLLKKAKNTSGYGGGLAGALLASALGKDDQLTTCTAADLPDPIRNQLAPKKKLAAKPVVIIPLSTISLVTPKRWSNQILLNVGSDTFTLSTRSFRYSSTVKKLAALGYTLNTPLTPTDAPVHDARTEEERTAPPQGPTIFRILKIAGAVALILAIIILRILAHR